MICGGVLFPVLSICLVLSYGDIGTLLLCCWPGIFYGECLERMGFNPVHSFLLSKSGIILFDGIAGSLFVGIPYIACVGFYRLILRINQFNGFDFSKKGPGEGSEK
jgi:hypothetical protein